MKYSKINIISGVTIYSFASLGSLFITLILGGLANEYSFSESSLASLAFIDLMGLAVGSLTTLFVFRKIDWHLIVLIGAILIIGFNILCLNNSDFSSLCIFRFFAEFGAGLCMGIISAAIGDSNNPDKIFSLAMAIIMILSILTFLFLPELILSYGPSSIFCAQLLTGLIILLCLKWIPISEGKVFDDDSNFNVDQSDKLLLIIAFINIVIFYIGQGMILALSERFGNFIGIDLKQIGNALAFSMVASFLGAVSANLLGTKYGRLKPTIVGLSIFIIGITLLFTYNFTFFLIGMALTQFAFCFAVVYLLLFAVEIDISGKYAAILPAVQATGYALGPGIASTFLENGNYQTVLKIGLLCMIICSCLAVPLVKKLDLIFKQ